jgi:SpoVK/Ycf46/Vps4 family AAA+-type ATPase
VEIGIDQSDTGGRKIAQIIIRPWPAFPEVVGIDALARNRVGTEVEDLRNHDKPQTAVAIVRQIKDESVERSRFHIHLLFNRTKLIVRQGTHRQ